MRCLILAAFVVMLLSPPALTAGGEDRPIPQDPEGQRQRFRDMLAWNQRTLAGAYDKVGKKDPRWDRPAHEALEAAARFFSFAVDPQTRGEEIQTPAKQAVDAGCDDPLILYLYARSSPDNTGPEELERRYKAAALALQRSAYPPYRQAWALQRAGTCVAARKDLTPEARKEASRLLESALDLLPRIVTEEERNPDTGSACFELPQKILFEYRYLTGDYPKAFRRVDAVLARTPALKAVRLQVKAQYLICYAWEARGSGFADTVTEEGWQKFGERLTQAREALEQSWALELGNGRTATLMLTVEKGIGEDREDMEKWFVRAMKADGNNREACEAKMDWLDPKWHGSREEMLAFGRACRDTKNWRAGITLLLADAHRRVAVRLPADEQYKYLSSAEVWNDIRTVYEEYLAHYPYDYFQRSQYAGYCYAAGWFPEADRQFQAVGEHLMGSDAFPEEWLKQARAEVAAAGKAQADAQPPAQRQQSAKPPR